MDLDMTEMESAAEELAQAGTEKELEAALKEALETMAGYGRATTFEEAGVLTYNRGLVYRTGDGVEFQITLVRSR